MSEECKIGACEQTFYVGVGQVSNGHECFTFELSRSLCMILYAFFVSEGSGRQFSSNTRAMHVVIKIRPGYDWRSSIIRLVI